MAGLTCLIAYSTKSPASRTAAGYSALRFVHTQWGKLIASLVEGDLHRLLNDWGIAVHDTAERRKGKLDRPLTEQYEFDIIATNGEYIVVVEVKTTLRVKQVKEFLWELEQELCIMEKERHQPSATLEDIRAILRGIRAVHAVTTVI